MRCCAAALLLGCICAGALLRRRAVGRLDSRRCAATFPTYQTYLTYKTFLTYLTYKNLSNRSKLPNLIYLSSSILFICYPHLSYLFYLIWSNVYLPNSIYYLILSVIWSYLYYLVLSIIQPVQICSNLFISSYSVLSVIFSTFYFIELSGLFHHLVLSITHSYLNLSKLIT